MVHYAETARSSTTVPLLPVPGSHQPEHNTDPLPALAQQGTLDWTTDEELRCWLYKGKHGEIRLPGLLWVSCDAAFAQGFWHGRAVLLEHEDEEWYVLTDGEFTRLIAQELPTTLPAAAIAPWKRGFIFGWCMTWYYQPFLNEAAESDEDAEARATPASRKRRKSTHSSVPKYPNALRACLKQAGYSFREVSLETAIPESTLYSWASGKRVIPHAFRQQLAHVIGCAVEELAPSRMAV